jgi:hypothetical protein
MAPLRQHPIKSAMSAVDTSSHAASMVATVGSAVVAGLALIAGDAAMAATAAGARAVVPGPSSVAWLAAATVIAAGSYVLVGAPQIALGRRQTELRDRRTRWAVRLLGDGGDHDGRNGDHERRVAPAIAFTVASVVAGPLAIGWFTGRHHHARAQQRTATAAAIFGATWAAVYLGLAARLL